MRRLYMDQAALNKTVFVVPTFEIKKSVEELPKKKGTG